MSLSISSIAAVNNSCNVKQQQEYSDKNNQAANQAQLKQNNPSFGKNKSVISWLLTPFIYLFLLILSPFVNWKRAFNEERE